jgi:hypothetical protein
MSMLRKMSKISRSLLSNGLEMSYFTRIVTLVEKSGYQVRLVCMSVCLSEWSNSNGHRLEWREYLYNRGYLSKHFHNSQVWLKSGALWLLC